ncbi:DUF1906 domain-containing protein [Kitasatospora putterlickiae]|uniref:DUF1906 domain-containing protein n=1 Tax=Kitasatospora putterlickiae TaxID=221725 RepID=A0ABN1XSY5_9ACTN
MADEMVLAAQRFINSTYGSVAGIPHVEENGKTGWPVMYALTRALQYEIGIQSLSDTFGPTTLSTLQTKYPVVDAGHTTTNITKIVQAGLYCKGYDGSGINGQYDARTGAAVALLKTDMGVDGVFPGPGVPPKVLKALLTMDAYVTVNGGSNAVRGIQRWMNASYVQRQNYFVVPCDGWFSRDVQKALMFAIQYALGMSDAVANGVFGPGTKAGLQANPLEIGSTGTFVRLFSAAMVFNRRSGAVFTDTFDADLAARVREFQDFVRLTVNGKADYPTWASLLVSTGDPTRKGIALDCVTEVTPERGAALIAAGYQVVGRYLTNVPGTTLNKKIQKYEISNILGAGLRFFPIYQTYGGSASYFSDNQGYIDGLAACDAANGYGIKRGTRIYFAVDFDALDHQITSNIIPHFRGIARAMEYLGNKYVPAAYGPRNVCSRVTAAQLSFGSFVSDMSTGFSGNLGFPMPEDWMFDQISTITVGSGAGQIEIDNNIASGRDRGQDAVDPVSTVYNLDVHWDQDYTLALAEDIKQCLKTYGIEESDTTGIYSTSEAIAKVLEKDALITSLARNLKIRKALIQVPILWEMRHKNIEDAGKDAAVKAYYSTGIGLWDDCSTGLGEVFARSAIRARNYAMDNQLLSFGIRLDPNNHDHVGDTWSKLNGNEEFNIGCVAYVHFWHASLLTNPISRPPGLDYTDDETHRLLARYQGDTPEAMVEGAKRLAVYRVFEKYNAPLRNL